MGTKYYWTKARSSIKNLLQKHKNKEAEPRLEPVPMKGPIESTILSPDILWRIFDIMSKDEERASMYRLKEIKESSHVCREWRYILLGSPSIWGRLIHIDYCRTKAWVEEIFRRSKSSPVWIDIHLDLWGPAWPNTLPYVTDDFVFALLHSCWERTEVFCWTSKDKAKGTTHLAGVWRLFQRAAPILRKFKANINYIPARNHARIMCNFPPFADDAPCLQEFETDIIGYLLLGNSWFKNLRAINLSGRDNSISFPYLMDILADTHQLEFLAAILTNSEIIPFDISPSTPLNLPSLSWISIEFTLEQFVHFMQRARPASGCSIVCNVIMRDGFQGKLSEEELFRRLRDPLCCLLESHVACHHSGTLESLKLTVDYDTEFIFSCCSDTKFETVAFRKPKSPAFYVRLFYWDYIDQPLEINMGVLLSQIYTTFSFPIINQVHCLDITYEGWSSHGSHILLALPLIQALPLVTCLHVDHFLPRFWLEFEPYNDVSTSNGMQNIQFPFPKLTTVYTDMFSETGIEWSPKLAQLRKLLHYCRHANRRISRIELGREVVNITALESLAKEFEELEIFHGSIALSFKRAINTSKH